MTSPEGDTFEYAVCFGFKASHNEAEYEATLADINMCITAGAKKIKMITDSQLVSSQIEGTYEAREPVMQKYLSRVKQITVGLQSFEVALVPRTENMATDALSKPASFNTTNMKRNGMIEILPERSINTAQPKINTINQGKEWYDEITAYKLIDSLLDEEMTSKKLRTEAMWYCIFQGQLHKKGLSLPLLRCVTTYEATKIIEEIHEGVCGNNIDEKTLELKALRAGFYWPTMLADAQAYVKKCDKCQRFAPVPPAGK